MKRYALFVGDFYEPIGGWQQFVDSYDTVDEAVKEAFKRDTKRAPKKWWHVIDLSTGKDMAEGAGKKHPIRYDRPSTTTS